LGSITSKRNPGKAFTAMHSMTMLVFAFLQPSLQKEKREENNQ
jgi:hypothetical protein